MVLIRRYRILLRMVVKAGLPALGLTLLMSMTPTLAADLIIDTGNTVELAGAHTFDHVVIDGDLIITGDTELTVNNSFELGNFGSIESDVTDFSPPLGVEGYNGTSGSQSSPDGTSGGNGDTGEDGPDQYSLSITVHGDAILSGNIDLSGSYGSDGRGGGYGGSGWNNAGCPSSTVGGGAPGGSGGHGGRGGNGGHVKLVINGTLQDRGGDIRVDGGRGGDGMYNVDLHSAGSGGEGGSGYAHVCSDGEEEYLSCTDGREGAPSGTAGRPGHGGDAGTIEIWAENIIQLQSDLRLALSAVGARGGEGAKGGHGGDGGNGGGVAQTLSGSCCSSGGAGAEGSPGTGGGNGGGGGQIWVHAACNLEDLFVEASGGFGEFGGNGGGNGSTGWNSDREECPNNPPGPDGINGAQGGRGGDGGTVVLTSSGIGESVLRSRGGYGDEGGDGSNGQSPPWPDGAWGIPGNGGTGGAGGNGGTVLVRTPDIANPDIVIDLAGGSGGIGGDPGSGEGGSTGTPGASGTDGSVGGQTLTELTEDLMVTLVVDETEAHPEDSLSYTMGISSATAQTDVHVSLPIPAFASFVSATSGYSVEGAAVSWDIPALAACKLQLFQLTVQVDSLTPDGTIISNSGTVSSDTDGPVQSNSVETEIIGEREPVRIPAKYGVDTDSDDGPDPVQTGIGNFYWYKPLFALPGRTMGLHFSVTYNSLDTDYNGPSGYGWTHAYNIVLVEDGVNSEIQIKWGDGHIDFFTDEGGGVYTPLECLTETRLADNGTSGWVATLMNGVSYYFDTGGSLTEIIDSQGNSMTLSYTGADLTRIIDQGGRFVDLAYSGGKLASVTAPEGIVYTFTVDGIGDLTRITDPRGNHWDFSYDGTTHRVRTVNDRRGVDVLTQTYFPDGRVNTQTNAAGQVTGYSYDDDTRTTTITPPSGNAAHHVFDIQYNQTSVTDGEGSTARFTFSIDGKRTQARDKNGNPVQFAYDAGGNLSAYTDRTGISLSAEYNDSNHATLVTDGLGNTTHMTYDGNGNLTGVEDALGNIHALSYNSDNQPLQYTNPRSYVHQRAYTAEGLLHTSTDPLGNILTRTYDGAGRLTRLDFPDGNHATITYDTAGNVVGKTDRFGISSQSFLDGNGNVISQVLDVGGLEATTLFQYNNLGRLEQVIDAEGGVTACSYDSDGNTLSVTDPDGVTLSYTYNKRNRVTAVTDENGHATTYTYDDNGWIRSIRDPLNNLTQYEYDEEGRVTQVIDPLGHATATAYDVLGRIVSRTDPLGRTVSYSYDGLGRLIRIRLPGGESADYRYDDNGNLTRVTDAKGHFRSFAYDEMDRMSRETDPLANEQTFTYDAMGNLVSRTDRNGDQITYAYDADDRLHAITLPGAVTVNYTYDNLGRVTRISDPAGITSMTYDRNGRRTSITDTSAKSVTYGYTPAGRPASVTYPGSKILTYAYNNLGQLSSMTDWNSNTTVLTYDNSGRLTRIDLPNGTYTQYGYDAAGQVVQLNHKKADDSLIAGYAFIRDGSGRIIEEISSTSPSVSPEQGTVQYSFDNANRMLTRRKGSLTTSYQFDDNGNLIQRDDGTITTTYSYDALNRLVQVADGTHTTGYTYDGHGNRIIKSYDGQSIHYLKEGTRILCTYSAAGTILRSFIQGPTGMLYGIDAAGNMQVFHADIRGSVVAVSDQSQNTPATYEYDPYGLHLGGTGSSLDNPFQYVGTLGVSLDENGLYHMLHRYYDPEVRRFISEDPMGIDSGLNLYGYVGGDPINYVDSRGLNQEWYILADKAMQQALARGASPEQAYGIYEGAFSAARKGVSFDIDQYFPKPVSGTFDKILAENRVVHQTIKNNVSKPPPATYSTAVSEKEFLQRLYQGRSDYNVHGWRAGRIDLSTAEVQPLLNYKIPLGPYPEVQVHTVDRFTFFFRKVGIQAENFILRNFGTTGLRATMVGAKVFNTAMWLYTAWEIGWLIGDDMRGWTVWDSVTGQWMPLDDWVAARIDEWDNGDWENQNLGIEYYRLKEKINLQEFSDELDRVWNMKP